MVVPWKPFNTAPLDRPVYLWDGNRGAVKMQWRTPPARQAQSAGWDQLPIDGDPKVSISRCSFRQDEWLYWCELHELEPSATSTIGQISDGYHTFDELYEHRFELWMAICRNLRRDIAVYKSRVQSDGTSYRGWFLLAMGTKAGGQISYHLPDRLWDACDFEEMTPPPFDGHTSADVLERLRSL